MPLHIGIAGAGVAGLTAALLLARQGHHITLHEQSPQLGPVGAGVLLQPTGQQVLQHLNLLNQVAQQSEPIERLEALTHRGKTLINLPYADLPHNPPALGLQRSVLFTTLHNAALAAGVTLHTGHRIQRYIPKPDGIYLESENQTLHGPYHFTLAADGARSLLRQNSPIKSQVYHYPHGALWLNGPCAAISRKLWQVCRGTRELAGILPTGNGIASLFWGTRNDEKDALKARGFQPWRNTVLKLCPQAEEIFSSAQDFNEIRFVNYLHVKMLRPHDAHCLFLGDAAHAMSPHLGQGINLALIDAYIFAQALQLTNNFQKACHLYTNQRTQHLRTYQRITFLLSPFFQSRGIIKALGRDLCLPLMSKFPPLRKQMILTMSGARRTMLGKPWQFPSLESPPNTTP